MKDRFQSTTVSVSQETKHYPPTPQWTTVVLMSSHGPTHAPQLTPSVPDDIYDEDDNRTIDSSSDFDSLFSEEMDIIEEHSAATSGSPMAISAKEALSDTQAVTTLSPAAPRLTTERLKEHQAWQDFIRAIHNPIAPNAQRYMIFADGYMWARNWREMENVRVFVSFVLDECIPT